VYCRDLFFQAKNARKILHVQIVVKIFSMEIGTTAIWCGRPAILFPVNDQDGNLGAVSGSFVDGGRC